MRNPFARSSRRRLALAAIPLAIVLFVAVNIFAGGALYRARLDLTEDGRFTLSPTTLSLVEELREPISLRLYLSSLLTDLNPAYAAHAARVRDMLENLAQRSDGMLRLEVYDPEPFSPEEDLAVADGIQGLSLGDDTGDLVYFGLVGRNATDDRETIAFFSLDRTAYLEYDVARLIESLAAPDKSRIGLMGSMNLGGDESTQFQPQVVHTLIQQLYETAFVDGQDGRIPDDIGVLLLVQPEGLSEAQLYALDQFALRGGRLLLFADPFSERQAALNQQQFLPPAMADLTTVKPLLDAWGVALPQGVVAADRLSARRVVASSGGRQVVTDYVAWLALTPERFAEEPMLNELSILHMNSPGSLTALEDASTTMTPLVATSDEGTLLSVEQIAQQPDPVSLIANYQPQGRQTLIARLAGPAGSAFPDGPPESLAAVEAIDREALVESHRSEGEIDLLIAADSDMLFDESWLRADQSGGGQIVPTANNGDFVMNAIDALSGRSGLQALRGRGLVDRPFAVIEEIQREAELTYRQREQELLARIRTAEAEIGDIEESAEGGLVLTPEQEASIEALRLELIAARQELRQVQRGLRDDLESLVSGLQLANIAAMPALVALVGLGVALLRRRRAQASATRATAPRRGGE